MWEWENISTVLSGTELGRCLHQMGPFGKIGVKQDYSVEQFFWPF